MKKKKAGHKKRLWVFQKYGIKYVINISVDCPQSECVKQDGHFMRIPINDSYGEKLLPYFNDAFKFLGNRECY